MSLKKKRTKDFTASISSSVKKKVSSLILKQINITLLLLNFGTLGLVQRSRVLSQPIYKNRRVKKVRNSEGKRRVFTRK